MPSNPPESSPRVPLTLARAGLDALMSAVRAQGYELIGPTRRDGAVVLDEVRAADELPIGWRDVQTPGSYRLEERGDQAVFGHVVGPHSPKRYFHVPRERLVQLRRTGKSFESVPVNDAPARRIALLGARACDIAALAKQDDVLMHSSRPDPRYAARRADVLIIAVACNEPGGNCFCTSMDIGPTPTHGFDLSLTELSAADPQEHRFLVQIGSDAGAQLMDSLASGACAPLLTEATVEDGQVAKRLATGARAAMGKALDTGGIRELLLGAADHPRWAEVGARCLACGNCTMVCPTCFCSRVDDTTGLDGDSAERVRSWDSCFSLDYSYMHGGPTRTSVAARYRHWATHKLATWIDQFGSSGCVGCGRCITWCPPGIDITEEVAAIRASVDSPGSEGPQGPQERS